MQIKMVDSSTIKIKITQMKMMMYSLDESKSNQIDNAAIYNTFTNLLT